MPRYVPEPTPDFEDDTQELRRYLQQELSRVSESVNLKVDRAYAGIFQTAGIATITPLTATPVLFDVFDAVLPATPDGVEGVPASASLITLSGGAYQMVFSTSVVNIGANESWGFLLARDGVSTGLGGTINPSNQTGTVPINFNILVNSDKGTVWTILINSTTNSDADVQGSEFSATRVSEEQ